MLRPLIRRAAVVLPLVAGAALLPVARVPDLPKVRDWTVRLAGSGAVRAPDAFGLVGVTWRGDAPPPRGVEVRTSLDGRRWSPWQELETESDDGPDGPTEIEGTKPLWVGSARYADVRFEGRTPLGAAARFVDPGKDPVPPAGSAMAAVNRPGIVSRAEWGADESIRRRNPDYAEPLRHVIVHHTATSNSYTREESARIVRSIYTYHVNSNGWDDIGYNFLVDKYGQIFEGRYGGVTRTPVGAHAKGFNGHTSGIAVIGSFEQTAPTDAAKAALRRITAWKLDLAYIDPHGRTPYVSGGSNRYADGHRISLPNIAAHRDVGKTSCPGGPLYDWLPGLRNAVDAYGAPKIYGRPSLSATKITPNGDGIADTTTLRAQFSHSTSWKTSVIDPFGKTVWSKSGTGTSVSSTWSGKTSSGAVVPHDRYRFRLTGSNGQGSLRPIEFAVSAYSLLNGTLLRTPSGWTGVLESQKLRRFRTWASVKSRYSTSEIVNVGEFVRDLYPISSDIGFRDGAVVRVDSNLWIISAGQRRPVSQLTLDTLGFSRSSIIDTLAHYLAPHPQGAEVTIGGRYPAGVAVKGSDAKEARVASSGPRPITPTIRRSHAIRDVDVAGPADTEIVSATGRSPLGFRDGTLIKTASSSAIYVIELGYRRHITSTHRFNVLGFKTANVRTVTSEELALHRVGKPL